MNTLKDDAQKLLDLLWASGPTGMTKAALLRRGHVRSLKYLDTLLEKLSKDGFLDVSLEYEPNSPAKQVYTVRPPHVK